jgi:formylglycine-generating enzyme required for sulfatase activity
MPKAANQHPSIFICYRRDDTAGHAGRLYDRLAAHFGHKRVFIDIDLIEPGEDFVQKIEEAVGSCEILLALIGRGWLAGRNEAGRRLDNPNDFVRLEIVAALARGIHVIPVLMQGARMPRLHDLPDDLLPLSRRNAHELSDLRWNYDVDHLIGALERVLTRQRGADVERRKQAAKESFGPEFAPVGRVISWPGQQWRNIKRLAGGIPARIRGLLPSAASRWGVGLIGSLIFCVVAAAFLFPSVRKVLVDGMFFSASVVKEPAAQPSPTEAVKAGQSQTPQGFRNSVGMEFVWIPPGEFMMGSESGEADENPVRLVTVSTGFYMGKYEVTQEQWQEVMGNNNPSRFKGRDRPVENVSWKEVREFISKLNIEDNEFGYGLPSEAQWEYAARARTTGEYAGDLDALAWYGANSRGQTHKVGGKQSNYFGLYDMHGNVAEWCRDIYHDTYKNAPTRGGAWAYDYERDLRVVRGGHFLSGALSCRSAERDGLPPGERFPHLGFRLVAFIEDSMR